MFKSVLWIRNKLGIDTKFSTFINTQVFVKENIKARFDCDKVKGIYRLTEN